MYTAVLRYIIPIFRMELTRRSLFSALMAAPVVPLFVNASPARPRRSLTAFNLRLDDPSHESDRADAEIIARDFILHMNFRFSVVNNPLWAAWVEVGDDISGMWNNGEHFDDYMLRPGVMCALMVSGPWKIGADVGPAALALFISLSRSADAEAASYVRDFNDAHRPDPFFTGIVRAGRQLDLYGYRATIPQYQDADLYSSDIAFDRSEAVAESQRLISNGLKIDLPDHRFSVDRTIAEWVVAARLSLSEYRQIPEEIRIAREKRKGCDSSAIENIGSVGWSMRFRARLPLAA